MTTTKTYVCGLCKQESQHSTNHNGEIYTPCKNCGNGSLYCKGFEPEGIETKVNVYRFNIENKDELQAYKELKAKLKDNGMKLFDVYDSHKFGYYDILRTAKVAKVDFTYVFDNQWNTNLGRLHDWYESIYPNKKIKQGYYLSLTKDHYKAREPKQYNGKVFYKGELIGEDIIPAINTGEVSNVLYNKYTPQLGTFDIWSYKDQIELIKP